MISSGQKVFEIEHLVNRILQDNETIECFKFRTINKTFDNVIQRRIRKDYQELLIGFKSCSLVEYPRERILVNDKREWTNDSIWALFEILNKTDKPILKSVNLRNIPDLPVDNARLHSEIVKLAMRSGTKKFFEMHQLCPEGCDGCVQVALGCREYGPMQPKVFKEAFLENKKHFEVLVISESLLCEIAKMCVQNSETKEQCLQELQKLITSNIGCDVLVLQLQDKPYAVGFLQHYADYAYIYKPRMTVPPSGALPMEVIDRMITEWKVKSLKLKFQYTNREPVFSEVWSEKKLFTENYMDKEIQTVRPFEHHLENVYIDLWDSLMSPFPVDEQGFQEEHLIGNIRKLFPAKKYSIITNSYSGNGCDFNKIEEYFTRLLNAVWIDGSKNIELSIRHFNSVPTHKPIENPRVPSSFKNRPLRHMCDAVSTRLNIPLWWSERCEPIEYFGRSFELEDEATKCTLKADIFISADSFILRHLEELYSREVLPRGDGDPNSLWPLVSDVCDDIKEEMMCRIRKFTNVNLQGPLQRPRDYHEH